MYLVSVDPMDRSRSFDLYGPNDNANRDQVQCASPGFSDLAIVLVHDRIVFIFKDILIKVRRSSYLLDKTLD